MTPPGDAGEARAAKWFEDAAQHLDTDDWEGLTDEQWNYIVERLTPMLAAALAARGPAGEAEPCRRSDYYDAIERERGLGTAFAVAVHDVLKAQARVAALTRAAETIDSDLASLADVVNTGLREVGRAYAQTRGWAYPEIKEAVNHLVYANTELRQRVAALTEERERVLGNIGKIAHGRDTLPGAQSDQSLVVELNRRLNDIDEAVIAALAAPASAAPPVCPSCKRPYESIRFSAGAGYVCNHCEPSAAPPAKEPE